MLDLPLSSFVPCAVSSLEREEAEDLIKRHGGRVTGSVSKKTVRERQGMETSLQRMRRRTAKARWPQSEGSLPDIRPSGESRFRLQESEPWDVQNGGSGELLNKVVRGCQPMDADVFGCTSTAFKAESDTVFREALAEDLFQLSPNGRTCMDDEGEIFSFDSSPFRKMPDSCLETWTEPVSSEVEPDLWFSSALERQQGSAELDNLEELWSEVEDVHKPSRSLRSHISPRAWALDSCDASPFTKAARLGGSNVMVGLQMHTGCTLWALQKLLLKQHLIGLNHTLTPLCRNLTWVPETSLVFQWKLLSQIGSVSQSLRFRLLQIHHIISYPG